MMSRGMYVLCVDECMNLVCIPVCVCVCVCLCARARARRSHSLCVSRGPPSLRVSLYSPPPPLPLSPQGAGDAFTGAFASYVAAGLELEEALVLAGKVSLHAAPALTLSHSRFHLLSCPLSCVFFTLSLSLSPYRSLTLARERARAPSGK